jgi:hypothetical protein
MKYNTTIMCYVIHNFLGTILHECHYYRSYTIMNLYNKTYNINNANNVNNIRFIHIIMYEMSDFQNKNVRNHYRNISLQLDEFNIFHDHHFFFQINYPQNISVNIVHSRSIIRSSVIVRSFQTRNVIREHILSIP